MGLALIGVGIGVSQAAYASLVCTSAPNQNGGTVSVTISRDDQDRPTISLGAQGGKAHFIISEGPYVATVKHEPDGTFYTFTDDFQQTGTIAVFTTGVGGKLQTSATTSFGIWKDSTMMCK